jgi:hypothetical protein
MQLPHQNHLLCIVRIKLARASQRRLIASASRLTAASWRSVKDSGIFRLLLLPSPALAPLEYRDDLAVDGDHVGGQVIVVGWALP